MIVVSGAGPTQLASTIATYPETGVARGVSNNWYRQRWQGWPWQETAYQPPMAESGFDPYQDPSYDPDGMDGFNVLDIVSHVAATTPDEAPKPTPKPTPTPTPPPGVTQASVKAAELLQGKGSTEAPKWFPIAVVAVLAAGGYWVWSQNR